MMNKKNNKMKNKIFRQLFIENSGWFLLEIIGSYAAAKVLLLGNNRISDAIDAMFAGRLSECINREFWVYVGCLVVLGFAFTYIQGAATKVFAANMQTGFRHEAGKQLMQLEYRYFDTHTSGRVLNNFLDDAAKISDYYSEILPTIVTSVVTIVTITVSLVRLDAVLTLLLMVVVPVMVVVSRVTGEKVSQLTRKHSQFHDEVNELAYDAISGINVVKSYNLEKFFQNKIKQTNRTILGFEYRRNAISSIAWVTGDIMQCAPCIILGIAALWRVQTGHLTIGEMSYFLLLLDRIVPPLGMIPHYFIDARIALVSKNRLEEIMEYPTEDVTDDAVRESAGTGVNGNADEDINIEPCSHGYAVEFKNVSFAYDAGGNVLDDFCIRIARGDNVALVGESGGGKSTIFKLICGFYKAQNGTINVLGSAVGKSDYDRLREHIALVSQDTFLFPESVAWNVACGDEKIGMDRIIECCRKARIHDDIMKMPEGYNTNVGERGDRLSGGQKQRLAIARALLKNAELILFDEPTASVDVKNEEQIKTALEELAENHTIITIAHRLNTIEKADCIYVLQNGKVAECGTHRELINRDGVYKRLYNTSAVTQDLQ